MEVFKDDWMNGDVNTLDVVDSSSFCGVGVIYSPKRTELITVMIELNKSESNI